MKSKEQFIVEAKKIHGDNYCYDFAIYSGCKIKMELVCKKCGKHFLQTPNNHLVGRGCAHCFQSVKKTTEEFIEEAKKAHGNKYDYSKSNYINAKSAIEIVCLKHGSFWQIPNSHLLGKGCLKCSGKYQYTTEEWVEEVLKKFPQNKDLYDYTNIIYLNAKEKVTILCKKCGREFKQKASHHMEGHGCENCNNHKYNMEELIAIFKELYGNNYDYSNSVFERIDKKIEIRCNSCNAVFMQSPTNHFIRGGCPNCFIRSIGEKNIASYLTEKGISYKQQYSDKRCFFKRKLPFDFFLPEKNILIEFQGPQHDKRFSWFHKTEADFEKQLLKDELKRKFCIDYGFFEIEIPYKWRDRIGEFLDPILKEYV